MAAPSPKKSNQGGKPKSSSRDIRDLDGDGDVDLADSPINDLDRNGRIDAGDREIYDLDNDNDIDATDRQLAAERSQGEKQDQADSVGAALGWKKAEGQAWGKPDSQSQSQGQNAPKQSQSNGPKAG